jgi:DNA-binding response OmpR family regulator
VAAEWGENHLEFMSDKPILHVEDEEGLADLVAEALCDEGHTVRSARTGAAALALIGSEAFSLVCIDLGLPDMSGLDVLKAVRDKDPLVPILILSARGGEDDVVRGLDLGADDYLVKPASLAELGARVRALMRRQDTVAILTFGSLQLDVGRRTLRVGDHEARLTPREVDLMRILVDRRGDVVTREELLEKIWRISFDPRTSLLDTAIHRVRHKLGSEPGAPAIEAVRGIGFRLSNSG